MQSLPVTATPPAPQTQAPAATDNSTAQATEPFGQVLARQRANTNTDAPQDSNKADDKHSSTTAANDATATDTNNQPATEPAISTVSSDLQATLLTGTADTTSPATKDKSDPQTTAPDGVSTLPTDMLAMMLPATASANNPTTKDNGNTQVGTPGVANTVPTDMLAMMLPANTNANITTTKDNGNTQTGIPGVASALPGVMLEKMLPSVSANNSPANKAQTQDVLPNNLLAKLLPAKSTGGTGIQESATTFSETLQSAEKSSIEGVQTPGINSSNKNAFASALETLGKDSSITAQLDTSTAKQHVQPSASASPDGLLSGVIAPVVTNQVGAAMTSQADINTPVSDKAWGNEFNQKITWMATQHEQTAELHLNPPNLGPLDVVLKVSGDQATALFTSPHAAVRNAVEQALPQLRNMLSDNGITLGNAMVSDQSPKDQQAWQANQQQKGNGGTTGTINTNATTGTIPSGATAALGRRHQGMVDTFA